jgi:hypothetical protein
MSPNILLEEFLRIKTFVSRKFFDYLYFGYIGIVYFHELIARTSGLTIGVWVQILILAKHERERGRERD